MSIKPVKSSKRRQKRGKRNGRGYQQTPGHVYSIHNGPVRSPNLPNEFSVSLYDKFTSTGNTVTDTPYAFGLLEYLNRVPTYANELYAIYRYSRVTFVEMEITLVNLATNQVPIDLIVGVVPASVSSIVTAAVLEQKPGSVRKLVSSAGGMDRITIRKGFDPAFWIGNPYQTKDYWVTSTQAATTVPLDNNEPVIVVLPASAIGGSISYHLNVRTRYHIQFFDLTTATNQ